MNEARITRRYRRRKPPLGLGETLIWGSCGFVVGSIALYLVFAALS